MKGYIYVLSNPAYKSGYLKVGCSSKDPVGRMEELFTTGVPEKFNLEYHALVADFERAEQKIHDRLSEYRPEGNREFFVCDLSTVVDVIRKTAYLIQEWHGQGAQEVLPEEAWPIKPLTPNLPPAKSQTNPVHKEEDSESQRLAEAKKWRAVAIKVQEREDNKVSEARRKKSLWFRIAFGVMMFVGAVLFYAQPPMEVVTFLIVAQGAAVLRYVWIDNEPIKLFSREEQFLIRAAGHSSEVIINVVNAASDEEKEAILEAAEVESAVELIRMTGGLDDRT